MRQGRKRKRRVDVTAAGTAAAGIITVFIIGTVAYGVCGYPCGISSESQVHETSVPSGGGNGCVLASSLAQQTALSMYDVYSSGYE